MQKLALDGGGDQPDRVNAIRLERPQSVVVQGTIIPGVLETAIDSDLPGYARATVSLDVLSFDRSNVLIPRGSRLIGRYESDLVRGQSRVFVVWTRLVRPDGASVQLASPVTDTLGRGGLEGKVDRRLFERYGGSALLSTLNAGLTALTPQQSTQVIVGSSAGAAQVQGKGREVSPVVRIEQGAPIRIFVARDLDFSAVGGASLPAVVAGAPK